MFFYNTGDKILMCLLQCRPLAEVRTSCWTLRSKETTTRWELLSGTDVLKVTCFWETRPESARRMVSGPALPRAVNVSWYKIIYLFWYNVGTLFLIYRRYNVKLKQLRSWSYNYNYNFRAPTVQRCVFITQQMLNWWPFYHYNYVNG